MYANSRSIDSAQSGPHDKLAELVLRHRDALFRKPISPASQASFDSVMREWDGRAPILLDAGCGVGWSTLKLAEAHPAHFVLGVDQSEDRLSRGKPGVTPANAFFARADLVDFWRLLLQADIRLDRHYLLYPNPWPKIGHLSRRWHGSPAFPALLALGGRLECRSNWAIYVEELAQAIGLLTGTTPGVERFEAEEPLTPFEKKYRDSGQSLHRLVCMLG
ncbi:SAM-dependent methyltransferase [Uliginosibacterium sp. H3]|uniref:tRNA (guanine(46)-N(7))-methyltransferase n=1 Tax=Uliginosibacterium silvisoli TaxID=3114758 RepID=A0ABU6K578_9RHOO|nr:SAM-dependent methyltransferase [Uliginosibacterium sp. H3]